MKYIFLIIVAFLIVQELPAQVRLSTMDSVTTFTPTDLFWLNTKPSASFLNRKVSWSYLRSNMIDYIDGLANTWALKQTFSSGATFSAGANGTVTFADSVVSTGVSNLNRIYPTTSSTSQIGTAVDPYQTIWARYFRMPNTEGNDSITISYDDSTLSFDKTISMPNLTVTESMTIDSSATFDVIAFTPHAYTIPNIGDTILTLTATDRYSMIELDLPGNMTTGISRIYVQGAQKGMVLRLYNMDASYAAKFNDYVGSDDNLYLSAGFDFGQYDYLELMCVVESIIGQTWIETGRSNN